MQQRLCTLYQGGIGPEIVIKDTKKKKDVEEIIIGQH
jgi:hypothetical protein